MTTKAIIRAGIALFAVVALAAIVVALTTGGEDKDQGPAVVNVPVDGLDAGKADDRTITVPKAVIAQAAPRLEDNLKSAPPGTPQATLDRAADAEKRIAATQAPLPTAGATAGFKGCRTSFVNNQSSRHGVRPQLQVAHFTVSPNRPGWSDVNAIVALFNRSSSQASSHFIIDAEGHCAYIVPIEAKSWTQAAGNPFSVSYEIVATGREATYLPAAGMAKLKSVVREVARRTGVPLRRGSVSGCAPSRKGIVQHKDFGVCGGGHVDITPFSIGRVVAQLVSGATCNAKCERTRSLRRRHATTHAELKRRKCAPADKTRSNTCTTLHRRNRALHKAAEAAKVRL